MWLTYFFLCLTVVSVFADKSANPGSSAGVIEREIEKEYEKDPLEDRKPPPSVEIDIPSTQLQIPEGEKIFVREIVVERDEGLQEIPLKEVVAPFLNRDLSLKEIYEICTLLEAAYVKAGFFLAKVYPPAQEVNDGVLHLAVLEGKLGSIEVASNRYYKTDFIRSYFQPLQGKPLRYASLLRALLLVNENSDLQVKATLKRGQKLGEVDLVLHIEDERVLHLLLNTNNYGKDLTTNYRSGGRLDIGNLALDGDLLSVTEVTGFPFNALYFTQGSYLFPLNRNGLFLKGSYLFSQFKIEEEKSLRLRGKTQTAFLETSYACVRRRETSLDITAGFDYKQIGNYSYQGTTSFDRLRVFYTKLSFSKTGTTGWQSFSNFQLRVGVPYIFHGMGVSSQNCSTPGAGNRFFIVVSEEDFLYQTTPSSYLRIHAFGQLSSNKLPVPEQIYLGGGDTVRGYPLSVCLGDSGYYGNVEWRVSPPLFGLEKYRFFWSHRKWKDVLKFLLFTDQGATFAYGLGNTFLYSVGVGAHLDLPKRFSLAYEVGVPLRRFDDTKGAFSYLKFIWHLF